MGIHLVGQRVIKQHSPRRLKLRIRLQTGYWARGSRKKLFRCEAVLLPVYETAECDLGKLGHTGRNGLIHE